MVTLHIVDHLNYRFHLGEGVEYHWPGDLNDREPLPVGVSGGRELLEEGMSRIGQDSERPG